MEMMKTVPEIALGHVRALGYRRVSHEWLDTRQLNNERNNRNNASYLKIITAATIIKPELLHFCWKIMGLLFFKRIFPIKTFSDVPEKALVAV